eukprot:scaffold39626_cov33-Prasinocladus_malaysianus.AAC.1
MGSRQIHMKTYNPTIVVDVGPCHIQDKKMELEGATEEHRQRRADRLEAAYRAKMFAQRGTDEELPVEEFLAKHGIQGNRGSSDSYRPAILEPKVIRPVAEGPDALE